MHRRRQITMCLVALAAITACQPPVSELSEADKAAVQATIEKYRVAAVAAKWDEWGTTLTDDISYSPPNMAVMKGRAAVVAWAKTFPKIVNLAPKIDEISGRGDLAYVIGTYTLDVTLPDGKPMTEHGSFMEIHRRQADGSWPYTRLQYHSTDPLPAAPAPAKK